jgi:hypothetical protein
MPGPDRWPRESSFSADILRTTDHQHPHFPAQGAALDPAIEKIVHDVSSDRIADTLKKLTSFETRGNFTDPAQESRGIGAARRWIHDQLRSYDPRLEVSLDTYKVAKQGTRILRDVEVVNVVGVPPGTTQPGQRVIVSGHYDSLNVVRKPNAPAQATTPAARPSSWNWRA